MPAFDPVRDAGNGRDWVTRPRVDALFRDRSIVQIVAPAGYGKSTAACQWATQVPAGSVVRAGLRGDLARSETLPGNLPAGFASAILAAYSDPATTVLAGPAQQDQPAADPTLVILDDLDLVPLPERTALMEQAEQWVLADLAHRQLVAISRIPLPPSILDPHLTPCRRMLGPADLAFQPGEVNAFVSHWARSLPPGMDAVRLHDLTGGWPIALVVAEDAVLAGAPDDAWYPLDRYLQDEILGALPVAVQSHLLGCWPLDELDADVWEAIDDGADPGCSFDYLTRLTPLADDWLPDGRHLRKLPEIVRQRLQRLAGVLPPPAQRERMVRYWLQCDRFDQVAIVASRLGSWAQTLQVLRERCAPLALRDFHREVIDLLQPFASEMIATDPDLGYWLALALMSETRFQEGEALAQAIDHQDTALGQGRQHILQMLVHIFRGEAAAARHRAEAANQTLPPDAWQERFRALATADVLAQHAGEVEVAERVFADLLIVRDHLPADQRWWYTFVVPNRADWLLKTGRMHEAEQILLHQLRSSPDHAAGIIRVRLAVIALEQGETNRAATWLAEAETDARASYWWLEAALTEVRVRCAQGDFTTAIDDLYAIIADRTRFQSPVETFRPQLMLAELWIQQGQLTLAENWLHLASRALDTWPRTYGHPFPGVIRASLAMASQRWDEALSILTPLADEGQRRHHRGILVQILAHIALAQAELGQADAARATATQAVEAAQGGRYVQSFQVFGVNIRDFLVRDPLLVIRGRKRSTQALTVLSERELEVVKMVAAGLSNADIADRLFISRFTVKNHLARINSRLGARNRRDAVAIATRMGLLSADAFFATAPSDT